MPVTVTPGAPWADAGHAVATSPDNAAIVPVIDDATVGLRFSRTVLSVNEGGGTGIRHFHSETHHLPRFRKPARRSVGLRGRISDTANGMKNTRAASLVHGRIGDRPAWPNPCGVAGRASGA